jgi:hypothetical protein
MDGRLQQTSGVAHAHKKSRLGSEAEAEGTSICWPQSVREPPGQNAEFNDQFRTAHQWAIATTDGCRSTTR